MNTLVLLSILSLLVGCHPSPNSASEKKAKYVPLSLEDSKKLITPTVYYIPQFDQSDLSCGVTLEMKDKSGKVIVTVCKDTYDSCVMQGTCLVKKSEVKILINVGAQVNGERRFTNITGSACNYGQGATHDSAKDYKSMCLDPYYSVAADLDIYKLGTVVYVPSFVGVLLPSGVNHDGYFVVRDSGSSIKGYGRFDFFSGFDSYKNNSNPFVFHRFVDKDSNVPYFVITGERAAEVLMGRAFPKLPVIK